MDNLEKAIAIYDKHKLKYLKHKNGAKFKKDMLKEVLKLTEIKTEKKESK